MQAAVAIELPRGACPAGEFVARWQGVRRTCVNTNALVYVRRLREPPGRTFY